ARSSLMNAVDVALADPVGGADPTIRVTSPELLPPVPFYLVVDPFSDSPTGREYMLATAIVGDVLTVSRNLAGSESTTHDAGEIVRITYVAQHLDDLFDEIELYLPLTGGSLVADQQIDAALVRNVTVGPIAPVNPNIGDLWMEQL
ncbi:MAG: hypothetical protein M3094_10735, partial [Actinomycetia bacterium]|nr:hypothetical protein [Actinomycetes bacterium]